MVFEISASRTKGSRRLKGGNRWKAGRKRKQISMSAWGKRYIIGGKGGEKKILIKGSEPQACR